jgi:lysozyme
LKHGIDVSVNNGTIDWSRVALAPYSFVSIKVTEGVNYIDKAARLNAYGAAKAKKQIQYYHFASLNNPKIVEDATAEAKCFVAAIAAFPVADLPHCLDVEVSSFDISRSDTELWIKTWLDYVAQATKHDVMIYSGFYFLATHLNPVHSLGKYKLWMAGDVRYHQTTPLETAEKFRWPNAPQGWQTYSCWQYSDKGHCDGVTGFVDVDMMH